MSKALGAGLAAGLLVGLLGAMSAQAGQAATAAAPAQVASASVKGPGGADMGQARFVGGPNGVLVHVELKGLTPGWHGLHFHEKGDCSDPAFQSAGAHINHTEARPADKTQHGFLNLTSTALEFGDLPNVFADPDGVAMAEIFSARVSIAGEPGRPALVDADGSALVVHASPDDYASQPIGGAGARVACGVIKAGP